PGARLASSVFPSLRPSRSSQRNRDMAKNVSTQWDFGDLFEQPAQKAPALPVRKVLTVSELTVNLRRLLEKEFALQWVTGEITNLRLQGSGHIYFTLKDA